MLTHYYLDDACLVFISLFLFLASAKYNSHQLLNNTMSEIIRAFTYVDGYNALVEYEIKGKGIYRTPYYHINGHNPLPPSMRANDLHFAGTSTVIGRISLGS